MVIITNDEFEKVYHPYLLFSKKRYAGRLYSSNPEVPDKTDVKGMEAVRRDSCLFVQETTKKVLALILDHRDRGVPAQDGIQEAETFARSQVDRLLEGSVPMHLLRLSKQMAKPDYKSKNVQTEIAKKMEAREPGSGPKVGDRVPYVVVEGSGVGAKLWEKAEEPLHALHTGLRLDMEWYLNHQLQKPLEKILKIVLPRTEHIFVSRRKVAKKFAAQSSMMAKFVQTQQKCLQLGCQANAAKQVGGGLLCRDCAKDVPGVMQGLTLDLQAKMDELESSRATCRRCVGNDADSETCQNRDCANLYVRHFAAQALQGAAGQCARVEGSTAW